MGRCRNRQPARSRDPARNRANCASRSASPGVNFRATQKLSANVDFEGAATDHAYFRTSLYNYQKMRARARYQLASTLALQASFSAAEQSESHAAGINYSFLSRQNSLSASWTPSKRVSILGEYTRSTLHSNINYLEPEFLTPETSLYRDNAHNASALIDLALPGYAKLAPHLAFGGSLFLSSGSRPTTYYQPLARLLAAAAQGPGLEVRIPLLRLRRNLLPIRRLPRPHPPDRHHPWHRALALGLLSQCEDFPYRSLVRHPDLPPEWRPTSSFLPLDCGRWWWPATVRSAPCRMPCSRRPTWMRKRASRTASWPAAIC